MNAKRYDPFRDGAITAIRIFTDMNPPHLDPKAELAFAFGGSTIITWNRVDDRETFMPGITGYTYIFDERLKDKPVLFEDFVKERKE